CLFFFFQAEDGIRDFHVTGVQTCALPIYATFKSAGSKAATCSISTVQTIASAPSPTDGCAAMYTRMVPNSASAMPTLPRMKYFQIGRASCRERVEVSLRAVALLEKTHKIR